MNNNVWLASPYSFPQSWIMSQFTYMDLALSPTSFFSLSWRLVGRKRGLVRFSDWRAVASFFYADLHKMTECRCFDAKLPASVKSPAICYQTYENDSRDARKKLRHKAANNCFQHLCCIGRDNFFPPFFARVAWILSEDWVRSRIFPRAAHFQVPT